MKITCESLMDCNASWEWTGERGKENCDPVFASSVSPQRLTFLPINRTLLLRVRQPLMEYPWAGLHCATKVVAVDHQLLSVFLALLVCVTSFPARWYFSQCPTALYREAASFSPLPVFGRHGAQTLASSLSLSGSTSLSQLQALVPSTSKDK